MDVVVGTLISSLVADYVPFLSVGVKIALGSVICKIIELATSSKFSIFSMIPERCKRRAHVVHIHDPFTAEAIERFFRMNMSDTVCSNLEYDWKLDESILHPGFRAQFSHHDVHLTIEKVRNLGDNESKENEENKSKKEDKQQASKDVFYTLESRLSLEHISEFIQHVQNQMPNRLFVHRHALSHESFKKKHDDDREDTTDGELNFSTEFFTTLEYYFLERDRIRSANLEHKGAEVVFGAEPSSFLSSKLSDEFKSHPISISLIYDQSKQSNRQQPAIMLQFESKELSVQDLKDYTSHVFKATIVKKSELMLRKLIRIHEVKITGNGKHSYAKWHSVSCNTSKTFRNTILNEVVERDFVQDLSKFLSSATTYAQRGIPFKRGYILNGPPGTGKSSLIKAMARELGISLFVMNLSTVTCNQFTSLISQMNFFNGFAATCLNFRRLRSFIIIQKCSKISPTECF
jgi:hypothetical protein